jgi:hypothetical protein
MPEDGQSCPGAGPAPHERFPSSALERILPESSLTCQHFQAVPSTLSPRPLSP